MADSVNLVEFGPGGRPVLIETLEGANIGRERDTFVVTPPAPRNRQTTSGRRFGGSRIIGQAHDNGTVAATWLIRGSTAAAALADIADFVAKVSELAFGRYIEWKPEEAAQPTYFEVRGPATWTPRYSHQQFLQARSMLFEVSFPVAPLALGAPMVVVDDFSVDSITDYTYDTGSGYTVTGGQLVPANTSEARLIHTGRGYDYEDVEVTTKMVTGASVAGGGGAGVILKRLDASNYLYCDIVTNGAASVLRIVKCDATVHSVLNSSGAFTPTTATTYWIRGRIEGNVVYVELWTSAPTPTGTPYLTTNTTLAGANATKFGDGIAGKVGIRAISVGTDYRYDDFTVRPYVYRNAVLPNNWQLDKVPGTAPADASVEISPAAAGAVPWALLAWTPGTVGTPAGGFNVPFGVFEGEVGVGSNMASQAKGSGRGGNIMGISSGTSGSAKYLLDFSTLPKTPSGKVRLRIRARVHTQGTSGTGYVYFRTSLRTTSGRLIALTEENGNNARTLPFQGADIPRLLNLGTITLDQAAISQAHLMIEVATEATNTFASGGIGIDYLLLDQADCEALSPEGKSKSGTLVSPLVYAAKDTFDQAVGNLSGKTASQGGNWAGGGDADDFAVNGAGVAYRIATSDAVGAPRYAWLPPILTDTAVTCDMQFSADGVSGNGIYQGLIARAVSGSETANHLRFDIRQYQTNSGIYPNIWLRLIKRIANVNTVIGETILYNDWWAFLQGQIVYMTLVIASNGEVTGSMGIGAGVMTAIVEATDAALATGGTLDDGKVGLVDENPQTVFQYRIYDNFNAWVPDFEMGDYPYFLPPSSGANDRKRIESDLVGAYMPAANQVWTPSTGLGGTPIEIAPGSSRVMAKLSNHIPEDPAYKASGGAYPAAETLSHTCSVHFAVQPRWHLVRPS